MSDTPNANTPPDIAPQAKYLKLDTKSGQYVPLSVGKQWLLEAFESMEVRDLEVLIPFVKVLTKGPKRPGDMQPGTPRKLPAKAQERGWAIVK